uniref:Uncharacterized protein n=1 Tax=Anopheles dirus TaxID=7168 RepID=A0A182NAE8_9DIPT
MLLLAFRSFFFVAVILGYSTGIWRLINDYFRREFQSYLAEQAQANMYLLRDPPATTTSAPQHRKPAGPDNQQLLEQQQQQQRVTDSIMALFEPTAGSDGETRDKRVTVGESGDGVRDVVVAVVAAAEVTDIRAGLDGSGAAEAAEDKWISYWSNRGGAADDADAMFCRIRADDTGSPSVEVVSGCD